MSTTEAKPTVGACGCITCWTQPPDAENRMSGGVGGVTDAIPSPRPDLPLAGLLAICFRMAAILSADSSVRTKLACALSQICSASSHRPERSSCAAINAAASPLPSPNALCANTLVIANFLRLSAFFANAHSASQEPSSPAFLSQYSSRRRFLRTCNPCE